MHPAHRSVHSDDVAFPAANPAPPPNPSLTPFAYSPPIRKTSLQQSFPRALATALFTFDQIGSRLWLTVLRFQTSQNKF